MGGVLLAFAVGSEFGAGLYTNCGASGRSDVTLPPALSPSVPAHFSRLPGARNLEVRKLRETNSVGLSALAGMTIPERRVLSSIGTGCWFRPNFA